jgi:hypothetical protein
MRITSLLSVCAALTLSASTASAVQLCETRCTPSSNCGLSCRIDFDTITTCGAYGVCQSGTVYDLKEWMLPSYPNHQTTHLTQTFVGNNGVRSEFFTCSAFPNGFFRVSDVCGKLAERFTFDNQNIFITRETFPDAPIHFKTHTSFVWARRFMQSGQTILSDCAWQEQYSCTPGAVTPCTIPTRLTGPHTLALGGDVGTVQALAIEHSLGDGKLERYFYAKPWGYVKFELLNANGSLNYKEEFNKITAGALLPKQSSCYTWECGAQIGCP